MILASDDLEVIQGDDYSEADGQPLFIAEPEGAGWPDLSGADITFTMKAITTTERFSKSAEAFGGGVGVELTNLETVDFDPVVYDYQFSAALTGGGGNVTLAYGRLRVRPKL